MSGPRGEEETRSAKHRESALLTGVRVRSSSGDATGAARQCTIGSLTVIASVLLSPRQS